MNVLAKAWDGVVRPMIRRPSRLQVAALCYRKKAGEKQVLLITTKGTGRWMLPKGWPMNGKSASEAARIEAWEEAGVMSKSVGKTPIGEFAYIKHHDAGLAEPLHAKVYPIKVAKMVDNFPEAGLRQRRWVPIGEAVDMVEEPGLKALLQAF